MKDKLVTGVKYLAGDRKLLIAVVLLALISIIQIIHIMFSLKSSDLQLVNRYSAYGEVHLYRNQWYYLLVFVVFAFVNAILSTMLAIKLYSTHSRQVAFFCVYAGIFIAVVAWFTISSILNIWSPIG